MPDIQISRYLTEPITGKFHAWKAIPRVRIFILGHPEFEYAGYLFSIFPHRHQAADWCVARPDTRAVPHSNRLVDAEAG